MFRLCLSTGALRAFTIVLGMSQYFALAADAYGQDLPRPRAGYDRPGPDPHASRSVTIAKHGMVATSHPLAVLAGIDMLRQGGNAVDAAIAANAVLGVVEPMSCGIGGDLFAIVWDAKSQKLYGLNASGRSPAKLNRRVFAERGLEQIPEEGPLSWSVPGCVDGWDELRRKFGKLTLAQSLAPAIQHAEEGFPVSQVIASYWRGAERALRQYPESAATFLINGSAPREGDVFRNPNLAKSYRAIAAQGRDAFYRGPIAQEIVSYSESHGGFFSLPDFAEHGSEWVEPVSTNYRGYDVWELPPNGQGIAALQMLNILEGYDLKSMGPGSADYLHLFIEAKKLAYADRARFYADPAGQQLPIAELISKPYAAKRRALIDMTKALDNVPHGDPKLAHADTVYLTVVDKDRNGCSLIQSNYFGFGSKMVPGNLGFALQNRGALFALDDAHPNRLEPRKRPFHTIIPALVTKDGRPVFCFGVMGGDMQPQGHVQVLVNIIDFGMNVQQAGDAARVQHLGSATPTGLPARGSGSVALESGIRREVREALAQRGHRLVPGQGGFGGYQGIWIDWDRGVLMGATEARKDGCALGY
jgi:gamma-glutamyltranspeptidase/glutathione hydrolase